MFYVKNYKVERENQDLDYILVVSITVTEKIFLPGSATYQYHKYLIETVTKLNC